MVEENNPGPHSQENRTSEDRPNSQESNNQPSDVAPPTPGTNPQPDTQGQTAQVATEEPKKPEPTPPRWILVSKPYAELLAYMAALGGAALLIWQTMMTREALDLTREALRVSQRAYVNVTGLQLTPRPKKPGEYSVCVIAQNNGSTPTRGMWSIASVAYGPFDQDREFEKVIWDDRDIEEKFRAYGVLAPREENRCLMMTGGLSKDNIDRVRAYKADIWIYGSIVYKDFFGDDSHLTRFCYRLFVNDVLIPPPGVSYRPCGKNTNCTDKDCAPLPRRKTQPPKESEPIPSR